ncbi:hypothetical protein [Coralloluteibacterium stylophorae]|uniref:Uncharacterized protein n=1 Tax=Coralloluteibacterium stylophorae TaxID=1776034 RepID=A0A8J7VR75_9GAMM|nr:hypothetical protein [Coralloluteibacterium stylophorae]MBS7457711.1 hypothetical protein [Coralloluteibacterium stylophorae]
MSAHDGITPGLPSDNGAVMAGYTREVFARNATADLHLLVKPDANLGCLFRAWCTDEQEYVLVCGWAFEFEDVPPE